mgnify:CR=1 FL=1
MEQEKKFYTLIVFSENFAGLLNQVTAVFTRRQVNIESLNVSASSIKGVHKYTITCWSTEEQIQVITKQIEKRIDVLQAHYFTESSSRKWRFISWLLPRCWRIRTSRRPYVSTERRLWR